MVMVSNSSHHHKEINVRRRIAETYNKREEDFPSLKDYNDYLEEVECMVFDLIDGINVEAIEEKIKRYSHENAEQIMINRARKAEELTAALAACKAQPPKTDADTLSNLGVTAGTTYGQAPRPTGMGPQPVPIGGAEHQRYSMEDEAMMRLKAERAPRAGGFSLEMIFFRDKQEEGIGRSVCKHLGLNPHKILVLSFKTVMRRSELVVEL